MIKANEMIDLVRTVDKAAFKALILQTQRDILVDSLDSKNGYHDYLVAEAVFDSLLKRLDNFDLYIKEAGEYAS